MKDEIKEILDKWNKVCNNELEYVDLTREQMKILLDYITNLQEENERLQKNLDFMTDRNNKKQEVIDKATEYIHEKQKIQYKYALSHIECNELEDILQGSDKE